MLNFLFMETKKDPLLTKQKVLLLSIFNPLSVEPRLTRIDVVPRSDTRQLLQKTQ